MPNEASVRERFFFMHMQKTAGTALWKRLGEVFDPVERYPGPGDGAPPLSTLSVDHLVERWSVRSAEIRLVTGHFPLCTTAVLGGGFTTFTVLREPVDRVLSGLRHHRDTEPGMADTSLEAIYDDPLRQLLLRNHMVKMLSLTEDEMTGGALTDVDFTPERTQRAIDAAAGVDVVGVQERFDEFCGALTARFGWDLGAKRFANRSGPGACSASLRARIADDNQADIELYEAVHEFAI